MRRISHFPTEFGTLIIEDDGVCVTGIGFGAEGEGSTPIGEAAFVQIAEYLAGKRRAFDFDMRAEGTDFQKRVWKAISEIPYGETRTYTQIAESAGRPKAVRAAGTACGANPIAIAVPCHRVVRSDGGIGNYEYGPELKRSLLDLERSG